MQLTSGVALVTAAVDAVGVARRPRLPPNLLRGPFTIEEAKREGLDRWHMEGASWTRVGPSTFLRKELLADPIHKLHAAQQRLPFGSAFSGMTAAWLHGIDVKPCDPIEATVPDSAGVSARAGIQLRRSALSKREIVHIRGLPTTSIVRTVAEVCGRLELIEAVSVADSALHSRLVRVEQLEAWAKSHSGFRRVRNLRETLRHVEPASESPMESRLRMILVLGGLPRPRAQISLHDRWHRFVGRPDLYYEEERIGIEYDGGGHRDTLAEDNRRQNRLLNIGVRLLRFTSGDVLRSPDSIVRQVAEALGNSASAGVRGFGRH